ncbi:hypothetical protein D6C97_04728 [Aureobasidium pullulans]|uniref:Uncharacterized protein n=1 Tax=Aureobasidium pullulans TaxID=5580 RepID=A0AB74JVY9_AURPU|nr:hypothetical protein D6D12_04391 [Aureobasidium pullulans]THX65904.1 hypothetical protein D6D11_00154 [Aureobasidium pullulans]THY57523.1 hypothetical protein D6C97_04728 [Aureobasidium pullulans]
MNPRDVSFNAHEQLEILAEIIKSSNIHPDVLVQFIRQHGINPDWGNVALPRGRTVNQCNNWFYSVMNQPGPSGPASGHMRSQSLQGPVPASSLKRPFSPEQHSFAGGRLLVPKPPMSTIGNILNQPPEPPKKKRGRPTNAEKAARTQQELAHGQSFRPPERAPPIASSSSSAVAPGPSSIATHAAQIAMTPQIRDQPVSAGESESSSSKKRGRPSNVEKETRRLQQEYGEPPEVASGPNRPGPSRYPNILSPDESLGEAGPRRQEGSPPGRGDAATYR